MKKFNPKWFRHEALHTTSICIEMVEDHLRNHHYFHSNINPEFNKQVDKAMEHLAKAYQMAGDYKSNEVRKKIKVNI